MSHNRGISGFNIKGGLFPTAFTGIREWQILDVEEPMLRSVYFPYEWTTGVNSAKCMSGPHYPSDCHTRHPEQSRYRHGPECAPEPCALLTEACGSGFWAYTTADESWSSHQHPWGYAVNIRGIVLGYGRVRLGPKGFRSLKAVVAALVIPDEPTFPLSWTEGQRDRTLAAFPAIEAALRVQFPSVTFFGSVESMLKVYPLTDLAPLLEEEAS